MPAPTPATYESEIASVLGVSTSRASAIAAQYPLAAYPAPILALSTLLSGRANFACPALQVDNWVSGQCADVRLPVQRRHRAAAVRRAKFPPIATHSSEIRDPLFGQPNAPFPATLNPGQEALAATTRSGVGELRCGRQPGLGSSSLAVVQLRFGGAVARRAAAAGGDDLRRDAPLLVLGCRMT